MKINIETKDNTAHFNELEIGDCFMLPNDNNGIYLRICDWREDYCIKANAVSLTNFDFYNFTIEQEIIKVDAALTIYK